MLDDEDGEVVAVGSVGGAGLGRSGAGGKGGEAGRGTSCRPRVARAGTERWGNKRAEGQSKVSFESELGRKEIKAGPATAADHRDEAHGRRRR